MKKKIAPKDSRLQQKSLHQTFLEILGIPFPQIPQNFKKSKEKLEERPVYSFKSTEVQSFEDSWFKIQQSPIHQALSKALLENRPLDEFLERLGNALRSVRPPRTFIHQVLEVQHVLREFERSLGGVLWHAVIKRDEKAVKALLDSEDIKALIKKMVNRVNRVMRLDKDDKLSEKDGLSLAYVAIKDAQRWYSNPKESERYGEWTVPFRDLVQRLPELFKRAFFYRLMEKINKEVENLRRKNISALPYQHPETGEDFLFLSQAALHLGLTERQLRYRISKGLIPRECYCRFNKLEGRDYYHQLKRKRVPAIMIPVNKLDIIENIVGSFRATKFHIDGKVYISIAESAKKLAKKRGIQISSAKKYLKRNREYFGGRFHTGIWYFPEKHFEK